ncbi:hypothetical protein [Brachybacterium sacelli]|uniref:Uncharacterized protein n=1 Tax=Brachybacterium sacelli TaxID=173364 RepID=A0ABS4X2F6_9MICO|nr:hypothetical protein [Brachybacterium sacelli]MBP2382640.1 hypothetical protein [Brachybacterium sacelli]
MSVRTRPDVPLSTPTTTPDAPRRSPAPAEARSAERFLRRAPETTDAKEAKETRRRRRDLVRARRRRTALRALEERDLAYQRALVRSGVPVR